MGWVGLGRVTQNGPMDNSDPAPHVGRGKPPIPCQGRESGGGILGEGVASPSPISQGLGSNVNSPSGVQGGALAAERFSCILQAPDGLSWNLSGAKFRWGHAPLGPLKSAYTSHPVIQAPRQLQQQQQQLQWQR